MITQTHLISQIQKEEENVENILKRLETENNEKVAKANKEASEIIQKADEEAREAAKDKLMKTKEEAKEVCKKIIIDNSCTRNEVIAGATKNADKAKKYIIKSFVGKAVT